MQYLQVKVTSFYYTTDIVKKEKIDRLGSFYKDSLGPKISEVLRSWELGARNTYLAGVRHSAPHDASYSNACVATCSSRLILHCPFFSWVSLARNVRCFCTCWQDSARELSRDKNKLPVQRLNSYQMLLEVLLMAVPYLFYYCCGRRILQQRNPLLSLLVKTRHRLKSLICTFWDVVFIQALNIAKQAKNHEDLPQNSLVFEHRVRVSVTVCNSGSCEKKMQSVRYIK